MGITIGILYGDFVLVILMVDFKWGFCMWILTGDIVWGC